MVSSNFILKYEEKEGTCKYIIHLSLFLEWSASLIFFIMIICTFKKGYVNCFLIHAYLSVSLMFLCLLQSLASQKPAPRGQYFSCIQNQNQILMPFVSTISTYMWYFTATPSKFSCATFKTFKLLLFCVDVSSS